MKTRILVVEDEPDVMEFLAGTLSDDYDVAVASNATEALDLGVRVEPALVVVDWFLRDLWNGLDVVESLRVLDPDLPSVCVTGHAGSDVCDRGRSLGAIVLEKPLDGRALVRSLAGLKASRPPPVVGERIGVLETDGRGDVVHASRGLRDLLGESSPRDLLPRLVNGTEWTLLTGEPLAGCWVRSARTAIGRRSIVVPESRASVRSSDAVGRLFGESARRSRWPFPEAVLIIDDEPLLRRLLVRLLSRSGCIAYSEGRPHRAVRLVEADRRIGIVLLDYHMPGIDLADLVADLRRVRPDLLLIGSSSLATEAEFERVGVTETLPKGWDVRELIAYLSQ